MSRDLETNAPEGAVLTQEEYHQIIDWWKNEAEYDGFDMTNLEVIATDCNNLDFLLNEEDVKE